LQWHYGLKNGHLISIKVNRTKTLYARKNHDGSAATFRRQVGACVIERFSNLYLVKSHKIANNSMTSEAREKKHRFGILKFFLCLFD
jgi:hypothetical protein